MLVITLRQTARYAQGHGLFPRNLRFALSEVMVAVLVFRAVRHRLLRL